MPTYIVARGPKYTRIGIDDVGDIIEVLEGDAPPSGPGYALSDIIEIDPLTKADIKAKLEALTPEEEFDEKLRVFYWKDPSSGNWYEQKVRPKYPLNLEDLTGADRAVLANNTSTSAEQYAALDKIKANATKYTDNFQTLKPSS